jgi:hypothetical protein
MTNPYLPETLREAAAVNRLRIVTLIADLTRMADILTADIEHEEERAGVRDLADPAYPALALTLRVRRQNLRATIASLEAVIQRKPEAA